MTAAPRARLEVRVHPGARREGLKRRADGALQIEVTAAPEGGRANEAVCALLARALGIGRTKVTVVRGHAARRKQVEVEGLDAAEAQQRLARALEETERNGE